MVILGNGIWKNRYGSDPGVIGRSIKVNDVPSIVIGVMPEGFKFPNNADLWLPLVQMPRLTEQKRDARNLDVFGRLADDVDVAAGTVRDDARSRASSRTTIPDTNKDITARVMTFNDRVNGGPIKLIFLSLMGAVGFVLLIACANVANLLLARSASPVARDVGPRLARRVALADRAPAAGRKRAAVGDQRRPGPGAGRSSASGSSTRVTQDVGKPYWIKFTMDAQVFAFFAAVCLGTGIVFGLAPALHVSKTDVNEVLKEGGRSGSSGIRARRWTSVLIVVELALTLVLLAGAGFMMRSFLTLYRLDVGVETSHLLTMRLALPTRKYPTPEQRRDLLRTARPAARGHRRRFRRPRSPRNMPLGGGNGRLLAIDGRPPAAGEQPQTVTQLTIGPRYFETLGLRVTARPDVRRSRRHARPRHTSSSTSGSRRCTFGGDDPIGRRIRLMPDGPPPPGTADPVWMTDRRHLADGPPAQFPGGAARPGRLRPLARPGAAVRACSSCKAEREAAGLTSLAREEVRAIDPDLPLFGILTMDQQLAQQRWPFRVFGTMFAIFAVIALALSAVGLYAVTAYSVSQRTQEIGVRMALGAQAPQVWWLILRRSIVQLAIGLAIGIGGALGVGKLLRERARPDRDRAIR